MLVSLLGRESRGERHWGILENLIENVTGVDVRRLCIILKKVDS